MSAAILSSHKPAAQRPIALITGGAGFVGTNLAFRLLREGRKVVLLDNLSRLGVEHNLQRLRDHFGERFEFVRADVRDLEALRSAVQGVSEIYHFAAQVAVTTSLIDPLTDFEINARGVLNVLEAVRVYNPSASLIFTSTNKVYGDLADVALQKNNRRYEPSDPSVARHGVSEDRPIQFHSPYGCSKGAADQYVLDYAHTFGLRAAVFRMSCIYGPHQCGNEDQGWVAHFIRQAIAGQALTLYGDGHQVRDILFVEDLVEALLLAQGQIALTSGRVFNIGGGPSNAVSLLELTDLIGAFRGRPLEIDYEPWRAADQRYYVSDVRRFEAATGWRPRVTAKEGVRRLYTWMKENPPAPHTSQAIENDSPVFKSAPGAGELIESIK